MASGFEDWSKAKKLRKMVSAHLQRLEDLEETSRNVRFLMWNQKQEARELRRRERELRSAIASLASICQGQANEELASRTAEKKWHPEVAKEDDLKSPNLGDIRSSSFAFLKSPRTITKETSVVLATGYGNNLTCPDRAARKDDQDPPEPERMRHCQKRSVFEREEAEKSAGNERLKAVAARRHRDLRRMERRIEKQGIILRDLRALRKAKMEIFPRDEEEPPGHSHLLGGIGRLWNLATSWSRDIL